MGESLRRQLLLSTTMLVGALTGYGGRAYGACINSGGSTFQCSAANTTTQTINANNADVSTVAGFSVNTAASYGITITGRGSLFYTDTYASPLTSGNFGLFVYSTGDIGGGNQGSVSVNTTGAITSGVVGIIADNNGSGALSVVADGDVTGTSVWGIQAVNAGTDMIVTTGAGTTVTGHGGIEVVNEGSGQLTVTANGDVIGTGDSGAGIRARGLFYGTDVTVTTAAGTTVTGYSGIMASNYGSGALTVTANGDVTGTGGGGSFISGGIVAWNLIYGTDLTVTTGSGTTVSGDYRGITARNYGSGQLTVTANGDVTATGGNGISALNGYGSYSTDLTVTTGAGTNIAGNNTGISVINFGSGALTVTTNGDVTGAGIWGIFARNEGTDLIVTTGAGTTVTGGLGIDASNYGSGVLTVTANGDVTGTGLYGAGIRAWNGFFNAPSGTDLTVTTGAGTTVTGDNLGIEALNSGSGMLTVTANGDVNGTGSLGPHSSGTGIRAWNGFFNAPSGTDLTVTTGVGTTVAGSQIGIQAVNYGSGQLTVTANGNVTGTDFVGIDARNGSYDTPAGTDLTVTTGVGTTVSGSGGIQANNHGSGMLTVTANGDVIGTSFSAIYVGNRAGTDLTVTTGAGTTIAGSRSGISTQNYGSGMLTVTANGDVTGTDGWGIYARNGFSTNPAGTDLTITTGVGTTVKGSFSGIQANNYGSGMLTVTANGDVIGQESGIHVENNGSGMLTVTANGDVTGGTEHKGISAENHGTDLTLTTGIGTTVSGGDGIRARNRGSGVLTVIANGDVIGKDEYGEGISADNSGTDLTVTTAAGTTVKGVYSGISAQNQGSGALMVTANGDVSGTGSLGPYSYGTGISAWNGFSDTPAGTDLTVTTGVGTTVAGSQIGIQAHNYGSGMLTIAANGNVTGTDAVGIYASSNSSTPIDLTVGSGATIAGGSAGVKFAGGKTNTIKNHGTIENLSGPSGVAVLTGAGDETLDNYGSIFGLVNLGGGNNTINNFGTMVANSPVIIGGAGNDVFNNDHIITGDVDLGGGANAFNNLASGVFNAGTTVLVGVGNDFTNSGTLKPGGSGTIRTTLITGNFVQTSTGILEVDVNAGGQSDLLVVRGTVNLTSSILRVLAESGDYKPGTSYLIIDNDGSDAVVGTFGQVTSSLAFLTPTVGYQGGDGNDVVLTLIRNDFRFCSVAGTRQQCNVAGALDQFPIDNPLFLEVVTQTAEGARQAFNALSGEVHATILGVLADDGRYVREALLGRLIQATYTNNASQFRSLGASGPQVAALDTQAMALGFDDKTLAPVPSTPGLAFWTRAYGAWGDFDGNQNAANAERDLGGFVSGIDARVGGTWRVGLGAGYSQSNVSVSDRHSAAGIESFHLAGYTGGMAGPFALRGGGAWTWNNIDTSRAVIFPGFSEREQASYDADTGQLFGEVAYPVAMGRTALEPFVGLAFVSIDTDSFKENGALAALRSRGVDENVGYSALGLRAATTMNVASAIVTPHVSAAWQHAFDNITPDAALLFASTGVGFTVTGVPLAEDTALIEAGLDLNLSPTATLGASYSGQFGDSIEDNALKGRFTWLF